MTETPPNISEVIVPKAVDLELREIKTKDGLIRHLSQLLFDAGKIRSVDQFIDAVYEREDMGPTYMSDFIAFPHAKSNSVISAGVAFGRSLKGIFYESDNGGGLVKITFLIAIPEEMEASAYINVLKNLARLLMREEFREALLATENYEEVIRTVRRHEALLSE